MNSNLDPNNTVAVGLIIIDDELTLNFSMAHNRQHFINIVRCRTNDHAQFTPVARRVNSDCW